MSVAPLRSPTATGSGTGTGRRAPLTRRTGRGATGGSRIPRKIPQFPQKKPETPPPPTPFQPGASPSPPLGLPATIAAGVLYLLDWVRQNFRTGSSYVGPPQGPVIVSTGANISFKVRWSVTTTTTGRKNCSSNAALANTGSGPNPIEVTVFGTGYQVLRGSVTDKQLCGSGANVSPVNVPYWSLIQSGNVSIPQNTQNDGRIIYLGGSGLSAESVTSFGDWAHVIGGVVTNDMLTGRTPDPAAPPPVPPELQQVQDSAPFVLASPADRLAPPLLPAAVPGSSPAPAPAAVPGGLPAGQPVIPPAPTITPTRQQIIQGSSPGSQAQIVTATGVSQQPAAPIVPVTPAEAVLIDGELIGGPGSTPPPNLPGMAAELGRLERKSELALDRLGPLSNLPDVVDAIADLVELLDRFDPGGSYSIRPACGTDANGDPLPPIEVPISSGLGVQHAVVARLDAIAELIDHHKQLRQPICKGKPTGNPVTVTAVEIE